MGTWTKKLYLHTQVKPNLVYYNYVSFIDLIDINECGKSWVRVTVGSNQKLINSCAKSTWYARRQHSYNICKNFLSNNSWMKNLNFANSCTINMNWNIYTYDTCFEKSVKTINSNNSTKFEVNWRRGSQFTVRHTKNRPQFDE
jgi:hypothetical protein